MVLYGAGNRCRVLIQLMELCSMQISHIVDGDSNKWGLAIGCYNIESPDILTEKLASKICVTTSSFLGIQEIRKKLASKYQIDDSREVLFCELIMEIYDLLMGKKIFSLKSELTGSHYSVIFDCLYGLGLGGIEEWTKSICGEFKRHGEYTPYILTNGQDYNIPDELINHILYADVKREHAFSIQNVQEVITCVCRHLPCVLVTSQPDDVLLAGKILKKEYGSMVQVVSGIRGGYAEISKSYMAMKSCTDLYVCVNSQIRQDIIRRGTDTDIVHTMLCPVECPKELAREYSLDKKSPVRIGYAGRIEVEEKRIDLLLQMIEELEAMHLNYELELAGEGRYERSVSEFTASFGCQDRVKVIGRIEKECISQFWSGKDICVNISDHEGRSRSTLEAMAYGAVPVVTDTWGVHDDIVDGVNGYIVPVGDYKKMAEQISVLCGNREQLSHMGRRAHEELKGKCCMEEHYEFLKAKIEQVAVKR